jgi:hypothetical protein
VINGDNISRQADAPKSTLEGMYTTLYTLLSHVILEIIPYSTNTLLISPAKSNMFSELANAYLPLAKTSRSDDEAEVNVGYVYPKPQKKLAIYHWLTHGISLAIILVLFLLPKQPDHVSWASCWNLHNYFCTLMISERNVHLLTKIISSHRRGRCTHSLHRNAVQWLPLAPIPLQRTPKPGY